MKSNLTKLSLLALTAALGVSTVWAQASGSASSGDGGQAPTVEQAQGLDAVAEPEQAIVPYYSGKLIDFKPSQFHWL